MKDSFEAPWHQEVRVCRNDNRPDTSPVSIISALSCKDWLSTSWNFHSVLTSVAAGFLSDRETRFLEFSKEVIQEAVTSIRVWNWTMVLLKMFVFLFFLNKQIKGPRISVFSPPLPLLWFYVWLLNKDQFKIFHFRKIPANFPQLNRKKYYNVASSLD